MAWELLVRESFSAAHYLEHYQGKCENMHGHTFTVEVHLRGEEQDASGITWDFTRVRKVLRDLLPDHRLLNEVYDFSPSAENLARRLYQELQEHFPVTAVTVWESPQAAATYRES